MPAGEAIWVCANCRSVNKLRAKQCYNCRTPKDRAAVDPMTEHIGARDVSLPDFHPSRPFAVVASVLILVIGGLQAINSLVGASLALRLVEGDIPAEGDIVNAGVIGLATIGIGLIALTAWAAWLSKAVRVMPALGLGYPSANGLMAFVENFIPVLNLWRVPAIVRDIVVRLVPTESKGGALIFAAWIGLIAGYLLPRFGGIVNAFGSESLDDYIRKQVVIQGLSAGLVLVGSVFLVALIWWIEGRISERRAAAPEGSPALATAVPSAPVAAFTTIPAAASSPTSTPAPAPTAGLTTVPGAAKTVPGPLGSMVVEEQAPFVGRPITALTGTAGPGPATPAPPTGVAPDPSGTQPTDAERAQPVPEPELDGRTGPRLELTVARDGSMVATLDGESEPITFDELRDAATALDRVDGSAIVAIDDGTLEASASASRALRILADAGVPATMGSQPG